MPKNKNPIPKEALSRILKKEGANRVSEGATEIFSKFIEDEIKKISQKSISFAKHSGRKTVFPEDVKLAIKKSK